MVFFLTNANVSRSKTRQLFDRNYLTYSTWTSQRHYDMKVHDLNGPESTTIREIVKCGLQSNNESDQSSSQF